MLKKINKEFTSDLEATYSVLHVYILHKSETLAENIQMHGAF